MNEERLQEIKQILDIERYRNKDGYVENIILLPDEMAKLFDYITSQNKEIERLNEELEFERQIKKEAREYIKSIPDDVFVESEHFTELLFILGKVGSDKE